MARHLAPKRRSLFRLQAERAHLIRAFAALPAWVCDYWLVVLVYRLWGVALWPSGYFFIFVPMLIVGLSLLFFAKRCYTNFALSRQGAMNFFLWLHLLNWAATYHFLVPALNGYLGFMLLLQALVILNTAAGFVSTMAAAVFALCLGPGGSLLFFPVYGKDDAFLVIAGLTSAVFIGVINATTRRLLLQRNRMYQRSRQDRNALQIQKIQLEELSAKLSKYLSPQVYASIFSGDNSVRVETYRKYLTIFFSDIQGFTEITERTEAEVLTALLNNYLNEMSAIALRFGGTIDKFIGDAMMVFFGDPQSRGRSKDALACVSMALAMRRRLQALRMRWDAQGIAVPLRIRMGINTGYCTVGNFGCEDRLDYTIIGGNVNIASRLESLAEPNQILISQDTYVLIKNCVACEAMGQVRMKGIAYPVQTYRVKNLRPSWAGRRRCIRQSGEGYAICLDEHKIPPAQRPAVAAILQQALQAVR
jgi:class 3 adenylate cyclase